MVYDANPITKEQLEMAINDQLESAGLPTDEDALIEMIEEHAGGDFNEQMTEWIENEFWDSDLYSFIVTQEMRWELAAGVTTSVLSPVLAPWQNLLGSDNSDTYDRFAASVTASPPLDYTNYALYVTKLAIKPDGTLTFLRQSLGRYTFSDLIDTIKNTGFGYYMLGVNENYPVLAWFLETDGFLTTIGEFIDSVKIDTVY